jgi:hypothetical protein
MKALFLHSTLLLAFVFLISNASSQAAQKKRHASKANKNEGLLLVDDACYEVFDYLDADSLVALAKSCKQMHQLVPNYVHLELANEKVRSRIAKIDTIAANIDATEPDDLKSIEQYIKKINLITYEIDDILKDNPGKRKLAFRVIGNRLNPTFRVIFENAKDWRSKDSHVYRPRIWAIEAMVENPVLSPEILDDIFRISKRPRTIFKGSLLPIVAMNPNTSEKTLGQIVRIAQNLEKKAHSPDPDVSDAYGRMVTALVEGLARHRNLDPEIVALIKTSFPEHYKSDKSKAQIYLDNPSKLDSYPLEKLVRQVHYYKTLAKTFSNLLE